MARETTKWPSTRWPITKIMSSDGCNGNRVPLEMGPWYDFREFGCHLGNVGFNPSWVKMSQKPSLVQSAQSVPGALTPNTELHCIGGAEAIDLCFHGNAPPLGAPALERSTRRPGAVPGVRELT